VLTVRRPHPLVAALAASVTLCLALAVAAPAEAARSLQVTRTLDWLHAQQGSDGCFQDTAYTPWAVVAIAASGENPAGSAWAPAGKSPMDYLQSTDLAAYATTAGSTSNAPAYYAKMILAYVAAGRRSSLSSAGSKRIDLVAKLLAHQLPDGRVCPTASSDYVGAVNATIWSIIALEAAGTNADAQADALAWLKGQQLSDRGFANMAKDGPGTPVSDVDDTAAAVQALIGGGLAPGSSVVTEARAYLHAAQRSDGGFSSAQSGGYTYSESTAWALQAILALGESPTASAWTKNGAGAQSALRSLQAPTGAIYHRTGVISTVMLSTTQSLVALAGRTFSSFPRGNTSWVSPFAPSPKVTRLTPADGATLGATTVVIRAGYRDGAGGTGVAVSGVRLTVDGRDVTKRARVSASSLSIRLTGATAGKHVIKIEVRDRSGNARSLSHTVTVGSGGGSASGSSTQVDAGGSGAGSTAVTEAPEGSSSSDDPLPADEGVSADATDEIADGAGDEDAASDLPTAVFPGAEGTAAPVTTAPGAAEAAPAATTDSASPAPATADGPQQPTSDAGGDEGRHALFLLGLALVPAAIGFALAGRYHHRWWAAIGRPPDQSS